jgi:hypothetical protein
MTFRCAIGDGQAAAATIVIDRRAANKSHNTITITLGIGESFHHTAPFPLPIAVCLRGKGFTPSI